MDSCNYPLNIELDCYEITISVTIHVCNYPKISRNYPKIVTIGNLNSLQLSI
eukprot:UN09729